ncbi:MAG: PQQ-dependent sugar dehydrogenase [Saprospiraceae bacterium]|nr:PQQ-dependent sugar dehydrogenase [Saprospiraceae bacterium]
MMKNISTLLLFGFLSLQAMAQKPIAYLTQFATGFTRPCDVTHCNDDRLFVVEQRGKIWILQANGTKLPTPFLDIDPSVGSSGNEQGLLGLAFHPNYPTTPYFFVNYTDNSGNTKISRFSVSTTDPNLADANSELVLLTATQPFANHNGGCVKFGPDGYLYLGLGDGGSGGDPQGNGQKKNTFLAKMLRIDVDGGSPYAVPPTNPFVNDPSYLPEIWALGVRNPWRFSFDRVTGDLWIGDVGQDSWEEIDFQPASSPGGENYGWRCYEGTHTYNTGGCLDASNYVQPVTEYVNGGAECSVTGGFVYRGSNNPMLFGHYLFTDYCSGKLWWLTPNASGSYDREQLADFVNNQMVSFGENKLGELFMLGNSNGNVYSLGAWNYTLDIVQPGCASANNGAVQVNVSNNVVSTVTWNDGFIGPLRENLAAGSYTVTITGPSSSSATETITLAAAESLTGIATDVTCVGSSDGSIDLTLNGTTAPPASVLWSNGSTELDLTGLTGGDYSVTVTTASGCVFEAAFSVQEFFFSDPPFINNQNDTILVIENVWDSYQWFLDGVAIPGANEATYAVTAPGTYSIQVTSGGCTYGANEVEIEPNATNSIAELTQVSLSPNPFHQSISLQLSTSKPLLLDLSLTDLQGRQVLSDRISVSGTASKTLQLDKLPAGTYLLVLRNGKDEWVERVVKM